MRRPSGLRALKARTVDELRYLWSRWPVLLHDALIVPVAWLGAYWFRYNLDSIPSFFFEQAMLLTPYVVVVQMVALLFFGVHRGLWRFTSIPDLMRVLKATLAGTVAIAVVLFFVTRLEFVPRSVFFGYMMILTGLLVGPRVLYRLFKDRHFTAERQKKVLVVGAGATGEHLVRDLLRNSPRIYDPVAFVDDDQSKLGKEIHGIRVAGDRNAIPDICRRYEIELILLALPSATASQMQRVVERCEESGVEFRKLPPLNDLLSGSVSVREFREVEIDDLLGRDPVNLEWGRVSSALRGKRILVTGGGGSIGSELCRQLARVEPATLILFERSEFNLYSIELELSRQWPELQLETCLGDTCDRVAVEHVFRSHAPEVVFHAAAYKHVPLLETEIRETVRNNVIGTRIVADAADAFGCGTFVLISTDKAVNPGSMMGASKRVAEILCQALGTRSATRFVTVRFGNVLGSTGSVVPLFKRQIESGGPVTVTDPDVTRYFMTPAEASQLILEAGVLGQGGEIYVLDMGEPIQIVYLAEQMIRLSGKKPGEDIEVVFTGLRPGEKLHEELFHPEEDLSDTGHEKIMLARSRQVEWSVVDRLLRQLEQACESYDAEALTAVIATLVPELATARTVTRPESPALAEVSGRA